MRLAITSGDRAGTTVEVIRPMTVGRDPACELTLTDSQVSKRHATFTPRFDGTVAIEDLGSRNGTFVDGVVMTSSHKLRPGQSIRIGGTTFVVEAPLAAATVGAAIPPAPVAAPAGRPEAREPKPARRRPPSRNAVILAIVVALAVLGVVSMLFVRNGSDEAAMPSPPAGAGAPATPSPSNDAAPAPSDLADAAKVNLTACVLGGTFPNTSIRFTIKVTVDAPIKTLRLRFSTSPLTSPLPSGIAATPVATRELTDLSPGTKTTATFKVTDSTLELATSCFVDVLSAS